MGPGFHWQSSADQGRSSPPPTTHETYTDLVQASVKIAKSAGARYATTPELSIPGYGLLDHFLEQDTIRHCWEVLAQLLTDRELDDILVDVGMPVRHSGNLYNARIVFLNGQILLIRPKMSLAGQGNYREGRYFIPWNRPQQVEQYELHELPAAALALQETSFVPFGDGIVSALDCSFGYETCALHAAGTAYPIIFSRRGHHHQLLGFSS